MIRVGFQLIGSNKWLGGMNYQKQLLIAISKIEQKKIEPILIVGKNEDESILKIFEPYTTIIRTSIFEKPAFSRIIRIIKVESFLRLHNISVLFGTGILNRLKTYKRIGWIPDFQHLHLPHMFSNDELDHRNTRFKEMAEYCEIIVLSSIDAYNDFIKSYPKHIDKARVLNFVVEPDPKIYELNNLEDLLHRFELKDKYFYLPNQFWQHKNHLVVFKAIKILKDRNNDIQLVCTGNLNDYRNKEYINEIITFIETNNLKNNIKILGLVDYLYVLALFKHCLSVINPSLFEGWSTTVEEAKSLGKHIILSNINVHIEQNPKNRIYFDPYNSEELAEILWERWQQQDPNQELINEQSAKSDVINRVREYGNNFQNIVLELTHK